MRAAVLAAVMACGLATGAEAAMLTATASLSGTIDPYEGIGDVFVPAFNTTLGTLTGAMINTTAFLSETEVVAPTGTGPLPAVGSFSTVFTATAFGASSNPSYTAPVQTVTAPLVPSTGFPGQNAGTATVRATFSNSFFAAVAADGFPLDIRYTIYANPTAGLCFLTADPPHFVSVSGNVTVAYSYDPAGTAVPKPASVALLGLGMAGLAAIRRRVAV